jgi:hypothetical protein
MLTFSGTQLWHKTKATCLRDNWRKCIIWHTPQLDTALARREKKQLRGMETQQVDHIAPVVCESGSDCGLHQVPAPDVSIYGAR